jgi:hypothetical protein
VLGQVGVDPFDRQREVVLDVDPLHQRKLMVCRRLEVGWYEVVGEIVVDP